MSGGQPGSGGGPMGWDIGERGGRGLPPRPDQRFRVFIRTVPDQMNQEALRSYFEKFGEVTDVYLPSHNGPAGPKRKGFGYVTFRGEAELERCLREQNHVLDGVELPCSRAEDRRPNSAAADSYSSAGPQPMSRGPYGFPGGGGDREPARSPHRIFVGGVSSELSPGGTLSGTEGR